MWVLRLLKSNGGVGRRGGDGHGKVEGKELVDNVGSAAHLFHANAKVCHVGLPGEEES